MADLPYEWKRDGNISLRLNGDHPRGLDDNGSDAEIIRDRQALLNVVELVQLASQSAHSTHNLSLMQKLAKETDTAVRKGLGGENSELVNTHARNQRQAREVFDDAAKRMTALHTELKSEGQERVAKLEEEMRRLTRKLNSAKDVEQDGDHWNIFLRSKLRYVQAYGSTNTLDDSKKDIAALESIGQEKAQETRQKRKRDDEDEDRWTDERNPVIEFD